MKSMAASGLQVTVARTLVTLLGACGGGTYTAARATHLR
jgi:hypothetical protein